MSQAALIAAIMAEVAVDYPAVTHAVGAGAGAAHGAPPRIEWTPGSGTFRGPQAQSGANPRPLRNRWTRWAVRCWAADFAAAEALSAALLRALHLTCTIGGFELDGEEWAEPGMVTAGDAVTITVLLGTPVLDRPQPTLAAGTGTLNLNPGPPTP